MSTTQRDGLPEGVDDPRAVAGKPAGEENYNNCHRQRRYSTGRRRYLCLSLASSSPSRRYRGLRRMACMESETTGRRNRYFGASRFFDITLPLPSTLDVQLTPSEVVLQRTVRDAATGEPVSGAEVELPLNATGVYSISPTRTTDADGRYQFEGYEFTDRILGGASTSADIQASGYLSSRVFNIDISPPYPRTQDFHLIPAE